MEKHEIEFVSVKDVKKNADAIIIHYIEEKIRPGISTYELDRLSYEFIKKCGAIPSCLGYEGYPATICASVDIFFI